MSIVLDKHVPLYTFKFKLDLFGSLRHPLISGFDPCHLGTGNHSVVNAISILVQYDKKGQSALV